MSPGKSRALLTCATSPAGGCRSALREKRALPGQRDAQMPEAKIIPFRAPKLHHFRRRFRMRKAGHITALDIDGPMLRLVQADVRSDLPVITRVAAVPLNISAEDRSDAESLGSAVRAALESARVKPGFVVMGVPRAQVI